MSGEAKFPLAAIAQEAIGRTSQEVFEKGSDSLHNMFKYFWLGREFSFEDYCSLLGMDASEMRRGLEDDIRQAEIAIADSRSYRKVLVGTGIEPLRQ